MLFPSLIVVEDSEELRALVVDVLRESGYSDVRAVCDGVEAMQTIDALAGPLILILDLMMPRMSGWEVLDAIATRPDAGRFAVVVVSATADPGRTLGYPSVRRVLRKPFELDELLAVLATLTR